MKLLFALLMVLNAFGVSPEDNARGQSGVESPLISLSLRGMLNHPRSIVIATEIFPAWMEWIRGETMGNLHRHYSTGNYYLEAGGKPLSKRKNDDSSETRKNRKKPADVAPEPR